MLDGVLLTATPSGSLIGSLPMWESACALGVVLKARAATPSWGRRIITLEVCKFGSVCYLRQRRPHQRWCYAYPILCPYPMYTLGNRIYPRGLSGIQGYESWQESVSIHTAFLT